MSPVVLDPPHIAVYKLWRLLVHDTNIIDDVSSSMQITVQQRNIQGMGKVLSPKPGLLGSEEVSQSWGAKLSDGFNL